MAAHTVFGMPELFEHIYWYNMSFAAMTINKAWNVSAVLDGEQFIGLISRSGSQQEAILPGS
jgi:hypothetical protein